MALAARPASTDLASEAWRLLANFLFRMGGKHMAGAMRVSGLNPGAVKALCSLDAQNPQPMGSLADAWGCDASNVTWLVDRLEERGFVERQTAPHDRRIRTVVLTAAGIEMRAKIESVWSDAPEALNGLDDGDLTKLIDVMRKLVRDEQGKPA